MTKTVIAKFEGIDGCGKSTLVKAVSDWYSPCARISIVKEFGSEQDIRPSYLGSKYFSQFLSSMILAAESIEGDYEATVYRNCWPVQKNYTPEGCKVKEGIKIQSRNKSSYYLWVHTESDFGHFCSYRGVGHLENNVLISKGKDCTVSVEFSDDVANVQSIGDGCAEYCGATHTWTPRI